MLDRFPEPDARLVILDDPEALGREAARRFVAAAGRSVEAGTQFRVALSGGSTPLHMYRCLATDKALRDSVHWPSVELFWGDERFVAPDDPASNYGAARDAMLATLGNDLGGVHPIPTDTEDPEESARAYQATLARALGVGAGEVPRFDLVLLGLGADGHTASLFPGALPDMSTSRWTAAVRRPADGSPRITLTTVVLNAARLVLFLVAGAGKAEALERVLRAEEPDPRLPASLVRPARGKVAWLADRAAAERIAAAPGSTPERGPGGGGGR